MGIHPVPAPVEGNKVDSDLIKDISNQLLIGKRVLILHNGSKNSRENAQGLLKLIPAEDVFRVRIMEDKDFENQREPDPKLEKYYRISVDTISGYFVNNPR